MIKVSYDEGCDMICIEKDGKVVFEGNNHDLPSGKDSLIKLLNDLGLETTCSKYSYED